MEESLPTDDVLVPSTTDQLIRPFDFVSLLQAAVDEEDRREQESVELLLKAALEDEDNREEGSVSFYVPARPNVNSSVGVEDAINSNGKRPRDEAWKVRKKANRKARARHDVYDMAGLYSSSKSLRYTCQTHNITRDKFDMESVKVAGPGYVGSRRSLTKKDWTLSELKDSGFEIMEWPERFSESHRRRADWAPNESKLGPGHPGYCLGAE
ncbi:hypothetical protein H0H92_001963 [Tricholoma furcatifolium]|nr:hypothetical protein H0H92_001963 [Tricholoma furcatifolium]